MASLRGLWALAALLSSGCVVGPDYRSPETRVEAGFSTRDTALSSEAAEVARFWTVFQDPALDRLIGEALAANHDLRIALANLDEARALRGLSRYDLLPTLTTSGGYTRQRQSKDQLLPGSERSSELIDAGIDAFWELDLFGRVRRGVEASSADLAASEANLRDAQVLVAAELARTYFEWRGALDQLAVAQANASNQRATFEVTQIRLDAGRGTELDTRQAQAQLSTTLATIPSLEVQVAQSLHRLAVLTGRSPQANPAPAGAERAWPELPALVPVGSPADLLRRRPDIRSAERALAAATARVGVATGDLFPRVSFTGSLGYAAATGSRFGDTGTDTYFIGPGISWAALDLGRVRANVRASEARTEAALAVYEQTVLRALEETENALVSYTRARTRYGHLREAAEASAEAARLARARYDGGIADFLQVLDAERVQLEAEDRQSQSRTETATTLIAVYKALGGGWEASGVVP